MDLEADEGEELTRLCWLVWCPCAVLCALLEPVYARRAAPWHKSIVPTQQQQPVQRDE